ncbi:hypothetical protein AVEN_205600-1 [Araneus ventricosus]|uniref:Uncharacterized protein n=1 Tax=Araneus ventricosus TaxID=182803 RepID=A0A4Y2F712_ARAVE|nr:hypothetical protein AVEN_205600-1 [Araneus ventricosus]
MPIHESDSADSSRIRFRGFIMNPTPRIRFFWSESDPAVTFEDLDPRILSGVNDSSLEQSLLTFRERRIALFPLLTRTGRTNFAMLSELNNVTCQFMSF